MAKNDLVSLSLIYHRPLHAYGINGMIRDTGLEEWARISRASIYNCLARLQKEQCVAVKNKKVGNMPERKIYSITAKGRKRLSQDMREAILSLGGGEEHFYLAATFGLGLATGEMITLLEKRIQILKKVMTKMAGMTPELTEYKVKNAVLIINHGQKHWQVEIDLCRELIRLLKREPDFYQNLAEEWTGFRSQDTATGTRESDAKGGVKG